MKSMMVPPGVTWNSVPFIESAQRIHYPTRVSLHTSIQEASATRPRRPGPWKMTVTAQSGAYSEEITLGVSAADIPDLFYAINRDAQQRQAQIPAVAGYHPDFAVTGLSDGVGGWLAQRAVNISQAVFPGCFPVVQRLSEQRLADYQRQGQIALAGTVPAEAFPACALPADRVYAMLMGVAIGDLLGQNTESMTASERQALYGWVDSIQDPRFSDDTQMTLRTAQSLLRKGRADPVDLYRSWSMAHIHGIGGTVRQALQQQAQKLQQGEDLWQGRVTHKASGNGSLMRVVGVLAPFALSDPSYMVPDLLLASALTHDDATANAACLGWAALLLALAHPRHPCADPHAMFEVFLQVARPLEGQRHLRQRTPFIAFTGSLCDFIEQHVIPTHHGSAPYRTVRETWYSGAYLLETVPTALSIIAEFWDEPQQAILEAVNRSWDNDTIAALVASAMGARHGYAAFDDQWLEAVRSVQPLCPGDDLEQTLALLQPFCAA